MFSVSLISSVRHPIIPRSPPLSDFLGHAEEKGWREWSKSIGSFPPRIMLRERERERNLGMRLFLRFLACAPASRFPSRKFPCIVGRTVGRTRPEYAARRLAAARDVSRRSKCKCRLNRRAVDIIFRADTLLLTSMGQPIILLSSH